ncbi:MAG: hypothetical protein M0C28_11285 [Candidatus Moduliflexus flocculans]|nr:hypothetical protein [Candidatus Moduliflexus flocculans]
MQYVDPRRDAAGGLRADAAVHESLELPDGDDGARRVAGASTKGVPARSCWSILVPPDMSATGVPGAGRAPASRGGAGAGARPPGRRDTIVDAVNKVGVFRDPRRSRGTARSSATRCAGRWSSIACRPTTT